jgi:hypothetical protein
MQLSKHLSLAEVTRSETAKRRGISNQPTAEHLENFKLLAEKVFEPIRLHFGVPIHISSGYRSAALNKAVGGSKTSQHCEGCAADFNVKGMSPDAVVRAIVTADIPYDQVILEFDSWVHISIPTVKGSTPRKQALIIDNKGKRNFK